MLIDPYLHVRLPIYELLWVVSLLGVHSFAGLQGARMPVPHSPGRHMYLLHIVQLPRY